MIALRETAEKIPVFELARSVSSRLASRRPNSQQPSRRGTVDGWTGIVGAEVRSKGAVAAHRVWGKHVLSDLWTMACWKTFLGSSSHPRACLTACAKPNGSLLPFCPCLGACVFVPIYADAATRTTPRGNGNRPMHPHRRDACQVFPRERLGGVHAQ